MKKILVTGGAGYIGSHTLVELSANNFEPIIVDNLCNTSIQNIKGAEEIIGKHIPFYNVDCTNEDALNDVFEQEKILKAQSILQPINRLKNRSENLKNTTQII